MGGWFSLFKSKSKKKPGRGNGQGNAPQNARQPVGNAAFSNDDLMVHASRHPFHKGGDEGGIQSSVFSNELMNIMNQSAGANVQNAGEKAVDEEQDQIEETGFENKIRNMGREELRELFLRVKNEGERVFDKQEFSYNTRRAYDFSEDELAGDEFNPDQDKKLEQALKKIDDAHDAVAAHKAFMEFAGNDESRLVKADKETDWTVPGVRLERFQAKLKLMARMIHDYPELVGKIGDMVEISPKDEPDVIMHTKGLVDGREYAPLGYNSTYDTGDPQGINIRPSGTDDTSYAGTHELGHILESLLIDDSGHSIKDWNEHIVSGEILKEVLGNEGILSPKDRRKLVYHKHSKRDHVPGQINTSASKLDKKGITTEYGATSSAELFAEAFSDVYQYGKHARKASIEIVKNYERKRKKWILMNVLRRRDGSWLLHQINPEKFEYSEDEERIRQGVKFTESNAYQKNTPDLDPRIFQLPRTKENEKDFERLDKWDDKATAVIDELQGMPNGMAYAVFRTIKNDIYRVKRIASALVSNGIDLPPLPEVGSKGLNPKDVLIFVIMSRSYQNEKLAEMGLNVANENAGGPKQAAGPKPVGGFRPAADEPLIPIEDPKEDELKNPGAKPKNNNIINENLPPRNGGFINVGVASHNPQTSSVFDPKNPNSKISTFDLPASASKSLPKDGKAGNKRNWYNKTELRVMEIVEAIENGEMIRFKLNESARSKLRTWILVRALAAQATVEAKIEDKKGK